MPSEQLPNSEPVDFAVGLLVRALDWIESQISSFNPDEDDKDDLPIVYGASLKMIDDVTGFAGLGAALQAEGVIRETTIHGVFALVVLNREFFSFYEWGCNVTADAYRSIESRSRKPAIATRLDAGEFDSVAEAERVARGEPAKPARKTASVLEQLRRLWSKATQEERNTFLAEIQPTDIT